jgi:hypothetical protein
MSLEKTMMGNPTGDSPKKPRYERMGGIDVGGSIAKMYDKASATQESAEERASRQQEARQYEARIMQQMRDKIGSENQPSSPSKKKNAVILGMPAVTPEKLAEYKQAQDEADTTEKKIKESFWGKVGRFFGRS